MESLLKKDLADLQRLNKKFHLAVRMRATYEPHPSEWIPIDDIASRSQFTVITKEPKK